MEQCVNSRGSKLTDRHTERHKLNITKCWVQGSGKVLITARVFSVIVRVFIPFFSTARGDSAQRGDWVQ